MQRFCLVLACLILIWSVLFLAAEANSISFEQRVACQRAVEEVYWKHTIWPADNPQPKPVLQAVMTESAIRFKTEEYLRKSNALESYWRRPITAEQMQAEMDRMAKETKDPGVLRELWAALHNDAFLIAEGLARPILVDRITQQLDSFEPWWAQQREHAAILLETPTGRYHLPEIKGGSAYDPFAQQVAAASNSWIATTTTNAPSARAFHTAVWTGTQMIIWGGKNLLSVSTFFNTGGRYTPSTNSWNATTTTGAPSARATHTAVWSGTEMIVWGGKISAAVVVNTGGRYTP